MAAVCDVQVGAVVAIGLYSEGRSSDISVTSSNSHNSSGSSSSSSNGVNNNTGGGAVNWVVVREILFSWLLTVPFSALLAAGILHALKLIVL
jgi:phosphate/sulfate permease